MSANTPGGTRLAGRPLARTRSSSVAEFALFAATTLAVAAVFLTGCFTPPALLEAEVLELADARKRFRPPPSDVELPLDDATTLRGFFVEAEPDAPIVLHLLESSASVAGANQPVTAVAAQLADLGYSSLMLDYAGVGLSSGDRSCANLERDARAMWDEALARAGGDASKVHVRATSIGTLALATLLAHGVRPASVTLLLPVMPDTVVRRFARTFHGIPGQWLAQLLYDDVVELDLPRVLADAHVPMFALSSPDETFIDADERARLRAAVERAGGTWCELPGGHLRLSVMAHDVFDDEARRLAERWSPDVERRVARLLGELPAEVAARFDAPESRARLQRVLSRVHPSRGLTAAALALTVDDPLRAFRLARHVPRKLTKDADLEALVALCDLDDPTGALPLETLDALCLQIAAMRRQSIIVFTQDGPSLARSASERGGNKQYSVTLTLGPGVEVASSFSNRDVWQRLGCDEMPFDAARRRFVRVLMKLYGIPERVRREADGRIVLEERVDGAWRALDLDGATDEADSTSDARTDR